MNYRILSSRDTSKGQHKTARSHIVAVLAQEILGSQETKSVVIASEHQLCQRFNVSRVIIRLALGELENSGLIFREHGIRTFAHGHATRPHRNIAVLLPSPQLPNKRAMFDLMRGVHAKMSSIDSAFTLIGASPEKWSAETAKDFGGVIVIPENITQGDLDNLKNRKLPYLILGNTKLSGPRILLDPQEFTNFDDTAVPSLRGDFFTVGFLAAEALTRAAMTGEPLTDLAISLQLDPFNSEIK